MRSEECSRHSGEQSDSSLSAVAAKESDRIIRSSTRPSLYELRRANASEDDDTRIYCY